MLPDLQARRLLREIPAIFGGAKVVDSLCLAAAGREVFGARSHTVAGLR